MSPCVWNGKSSFAKKKKKKSPSETKASNFMAELKTPVAYPAGCISAMNLQRPPRGPYGGYGTRSRLPAILRAAPHFTHTL